MALKTIMLLLTLAGDGSVHVNFSEAENAAACTAKMAGVRKVLDSAGIELIDVRCAASGIAVTKYKRGLPADAPRFTYKVTLKGEGFSAVPVDAGDCTENRSEGVFCATSTQQPIAAD